MVSLELDSENNIVSQNRKVNESLCVNGGARILLAGSVNDCFAYNAACGHVLSLSMWIKPTALTGAHLTHALNSINVKMGTGNEIRTWVNDQPQIISGIYSALTAIVGQWMHITVTHNRATGASLYISGVLEMFESISEALHRNSWGLRLLHWS